jgi:hypothetical protein
MSSISGGATYLGPGLFALGFAIAPLQGCGLRHGNENELCNELLTQDPTVYHLSPVATLQEFHCQPMPMGRGTRRRLSCTSRRSTGLW